MPGGKTLVFEQGDRLYIVAPLTLSQPTAQDIEEYAFGKDLVAELRQRAPNEHLSWFAGHYVEADNPNRNGQMWTAGEIALKSMTPMFCPVTVMHDPATAVGLIADLRLRTPEADQVPRAKIETALACWRHRFPDVIEEAEENARLGTLDQSMEAVCPAYDCAECGAHFHKLPKGAEQSDWCAHLKGNGERPPARILRQTVFTGTGLIFGTRGAEPADRAANLESFQQEVADFHQQKHADRPRRKRNKMAEITVEQSEWDRIKSERDNALRDRDEALAKVTAAEAEKAQAVKDQEAAEATKIKAEEEAKTIKAELDTAKETARQVELADERFEKIGAGFQAKLGDKTKERLRTQAKSLSDDEWTARLEELEELTGVKIDEAAAPGKEDEFSKREIASAGFRPGGGSGDSPKEPAPAQRRSVIGALVGSGTKN